MERFLFTLSEGIFLPKNGLSRYRKNQQEKVPVQPDQGKECSIMFRTNKLPQTQPPINSYGVIGDYNSIWKLTFPARGPCETRSGLIS
jgi:hypothetical protein